jgi:hypothetical protein
MIKKIQNKLIDKQNRNDDKKILLVHQTQFFLKYNNAIDHCYNKLKRGLLFYIILYCSKLQSSFSKSINFTCFTQYYIIIILY